MVYNFHIAHSEKALFKNVQSPALQVATMLLTATKSAFIAVPLSNFSITT